jgi:hypothetical protein
VTIDSGNASTWQDEEGSYLGTDQVGVTGLQAFGNLSIKTGTGNDMVGIGDDELLLDQMEELFQDLVGATIEDVAGGVGVSRAAGVSTGSGSDSVVVANSEADSFSLDAGSGDDAASIVNSVANSVRVAMGAGIDALSLLSESEWIPIRPSSLDGGPPGPGGEEGDVLDAWLNGEQIPDNGTYGPLTVGNFEFFDI